MNCILPPYVLSKLEREKKIRFRTDRLAEKFRHRRSLAPMRLSSPLPGQAYRLVYDSRNTETQRLFLVREEGQSPVHDIDADAAYDLTGVAYRFFRDSLHWNSMDNRGMNLVSNVHLGRDYNNAFWDGDEMCYGDGDGTWFTGFARAIDVTAHEMAHGVVQFTAGLLYDGQPGALNEHFADVIGTVVKQHHKGQDQHTADWLLGDEIMGPELKGRAIRSLKDPSDDNVPLDPQPSHMSDYYQGSEDNHGVHINSGIPNLIFYKVAMQCGTLPSARLWFEALKQLQQASRFVDLFDALTDCIHPLVHEGTLPLNALGVLENAFHESGILEYHMPHNLQLACLPKHGAARELETWNYPH